MTGEAVGWRKLVAGFPWFEGEGRFPLPAYSEFMPAPRIGRSVYGDVDASLFAPDDRWGFRISEIEEAHELRPGLVTAAEQVMKKLLAFASDTSSIHVAGPNGRNLDGNPFWGSDLAAEAGQLRRRTHVLLLPVALSKTQDDRGHVRWTLFGCSEQGPGRAFWESFFTEPGRELPARRSRALVSDLLARAYGVVTRSAEELYRAGFRILPSRSAAFPPDERVLHWYVDPLPEWTRRFRVDDAAELTRVRFLLTFRPWSRLPESVRRAYLDGHVELIPTPLSALLWGMPVYRHAHRYYSMALQYPLLRLLSRHEGVGLRVPQLGWLHQPRLDGQPVDVGTEIILNSYTRTHRWDRLMRDEDAIAQNMHVHKVSTTLFSTALDDLALYHKPMARNAQIWTRDGELVLNGPTATADEIRKALATVMAGGLFLYRFQFPAMRVGQHELYWQRPMSAVWSPETETTRWLELDLPGYLTAYHCGGHERDTLELTKAEVLYPRLLRRPERLDALHRVDAKGDYFRNQTALNLVGILDAADGWGARLPRRFARQMLRVSKERRRLGGWVDVVMENAESPTVANRLRRAIARSVEPTDEKWPAPITYERTATRAYEESYWNDLVTLSHGKFVNKVNADVVQDEPTRKHVAHPHRDLFALGEYLIGRHRAAIAAAGMEGAAVVGDQPFKWETDFDYAAFGGWRRNQDGHELERNILVVIPGKNRSEAVVMGDHYDTAYMEDVYETARGGDGARIAAQGADDNASATATLLQAAPILLDLARHGKLERDVWLIHLTGEEFPSDCMGARAFCRSLVERTLRLRVGDRSLDLSNVRVVGALVMDMIAHNRSTARDVFQISPGRGSAALRLAYQAHLANMTWNERGELWNRSAERLGRGRGARSRDAATIPAIALHPQLEGEVRTPDNPQSSVFNTDVQIFSDVGVPSLLVMENYDINRTGYHDTQDTLANIDLDFGAAVSAICIETIARLATR